MEFTPINSAFEQAADEWQIEVDNLAAQLLRSGEASSPAEAQTKARAMVQLQRRARPTLEFAEFTRVGDQVITKVLERGGSIQG